MGKIRTRVVGDEEAEKAAKAEQKRKAEEKKLEKKKKTAETVAEEKPVQAEKKEKTEETAEAKPKKQKKGAPVSTKKRGKKYAELKKMVEAGKTYTLAQAMALLKNMKGTSFDGSVELHINVDETGLKGELDLPHSTGKTVRVAIVDDKILSEIEKGHLEFDILVSHPSYMPKLARFAKVLGPRGLMPNPKAGTISPKPEEVAKKYEKGLTRWKTEPKFPLVHQMIGKMSLEEKALIENAQALLKSIGRPHILKAVAKSTMSPGIRLDIDSF